MLRLVLIQFIKPRENWKVISTEDYEILPGNAVISCFWMVQFRLVKMEAFAKFIYKFNAFIFKIQTRKCQKEVHSLMLSFTWNGNHIEKELSF